MAKRTTRPSIPKAVRVSETAETYAALVSPRTDQAADTGAADSSTRAVSMGSEPSEEEIRMRAYRRYLERGGAHGQDFDDWLAAERELKSLR